MNSSIFRAYDIRAIYPSDISKEDAYKIGFGTAKFLQARNPGKKISVVVGEDARRASPDLRGAVIDALTKAGADVYYIGQATTPLFYYSVIQLHADGGLMATASHNPQEYGGLKIVGAEAMPIGGDSGLKDIEVLANGDLVPSEKPGKIEEANFVSMYTDFVINRTHMNLEKLKRFKIVVDAGNGMTSLVLVPLLKKIGIEYEPLFFDIDCTFPNHSPDTSKPEAVEKLKNKILELKANLGVAFDGDGDRIAFLDENGERINPGYILAILFNSRKGLFKRPTAVYDLRLSQSVKELFNGSGMRSKVGHALIKRMMKEKDADIGAEMSGHFFFKEMEYAESSMLAMLGVLKIMANAGKPLSELVKPFEKYFYSGEINMEIQNREEVIRMIKNKYKGEKMDELDGVTVDMWEGGGWWFNIRSSNTEPILRMVIEAKTKDLLDSKVLELRQSIC